MRCISTKILVFLIFPAMQKCNAKMWAWVQSPSAVFVSNWTRCSLHTSSKPRQSEPQQLNCAAQTQCEYAQKPAHVWGYAWYDHGYSSDMSGKGNRNTMVNSSYGHELPRGRGKITSPLSKVSGIKKVIIPPVT